MIFLIYFVNIVNYINWFFTSWFLDVEIDLHSWAKRHWLWYPFYILYMLLDFICYSFVKGFFICGLVMSLSGFGTRVILASENELGNISSSSIFWGWFCRTGIISLSVWENLPVKPFGHGVYWGLGGKFSTTHPVSSIDIGQLRLSISSWVSFGSLYLSRNCSVWSKLLNLWTWRCSACCLIIILTPVDPVVVYPFSFQILAIGFFSFFLFSLTRVYQFYWSFQRTSFWFSSLFSIAFVFSFHWFML